MTSICNCDLLYRQWRRRDINNSRIGSVYFLPTDISKLIMMDRRERERVKHYSDTYTVKKQKKQL